MKTIITNTNKEAMKDHIPHQDQGVTENDWTLLYKRLGAKPVPSNYVGRTYHRCG